MVSMTRLDCVIGSAAGQRAAVVQAVHHARHRRAFGSGLIDAPLMREVLADLCVESAAATALFVRLARTVDDDERALARLAVPAAKFWVCKRTVTVVAEALECLGGNGYVEESGLPRLYRESPLNSIWEGSGNVIALDVVRAATREPPSVAALLAELATTAGADRALDGAVSQLTSQLAGLGQDPGADQRGARQLSAIVGQVSSWFASRPSRTGPRRPVPGRPHRAVGRTRRPSGSGNGHRARSDSRNLEPVRLGGAALGGRRHDFEVSVGRCLAGLVGVGDGSRSPLVRAVGLLVGRARPTDRDLPGLQIDALAT